MEGNPVDAPSTINLAALMMHNVEESIAAGERDRRLQENRYLLDAVPAAEIGSRAGPVHAASLKVWNAIAERSGRSEEHTSELQSLMRISYAVFCLKKKK